VKKVLIMREKKHFHMKVLRGQGLLTLTDTELYFKQWVSNNEYRVPLNKVCKVSYARSHNGKSNLYTVLQIHYTNDAGEHRIFGVQVGWKKDTLTWKQEIEKLMG
jgi:hypothetical protein